MLVMKFGGTSVASAEKINKVKAILESKKDPFIVVVSAFSGTTDALQHLAKSALEGTHKVSLETLIEKHFTVIKALFQKEEQTKIISSVQKEFDQLENICSDIHLQQELSDKTLANIMSYGERLSSFIIHQYLVREGMDINLLDSTQLIKANGDYLNAEVDFELTDATINKNLNGNNFIAPGFVASNSEDEIVLLGRGGSDFTAAIYAGAINASSLEIWSDVDGMLNASPKLVADATTINELSYREAFELAYFGAKVLYPPAVLPVMKKEIPVYLKNTVKPDFEGTIINSNSSANRDKIKGVSSLSDISIIIISGVGLAGTKGSARRVFHALEEANINIILISQGCSEQSICLGIKSGEAKKAKKSITSAFEYELQRGLLNPLEVSSDHAIIAVVGDGMKYQTGLSGRVFGALGENGVNIVAVAQGASERNISIVVEKKYESKAVNVIHERFFQESLKKVHLFIAGVGNVGSAFLKIIERQREKLKKDNLIDLKIVGVANSKKMLLDPEGLGMEKISKINDEGVAYDSFTEYVDKIKAFNLRNSVFIDNTASKEVSEAYASILSGTISVATCNKIASSSEYSNYHKLLQLAREKNCRFQYETTVGAALPVIKTIKDMMIGGDKIYKIEAVLSGSLNFIFNHYDTSDYFANVVLQAREEGYTEPDPLIDLSGLDVMRKILILARESGYVRDIEDVHFDGFLPENCTNAKGLDNLVQELKNSEAHFKNMYDEANKKGKRLKVIASMNEGKLSVALREISPESPFYYLAGKDNIVALNTNTYEEEPLIIRGAGAGAMVTASGVFSDLMYIVNR